MATNEGDAKRRGESTHTVRAAERPQQHSAQPRRSRRAEKHVSDAAAMRPRLVGVETSEEDEPLVIDAAPVNSILYRGRISEFHPVGAVLGESGHIAESFDHRF